MTARRSVQMSRSKRRSNEIGGTGRWSARRDYYANRDKLAA